jgi:hypothetical protein
MGGAMPDNLAELTARLEQLVSEIMKETDPVRYDELAGEIWQVLGERERLVRQNPASSDPPGGKVA